MNDITFEDSGMEEFQDMLGSYLSKVDEKSALDAIEEGAKEFVNDLLRLPKPRRKVTAPGYTHLVDSFSYKRDKTGIDVRWGKYYGPMLEHGTKKMSAKAHLKPLFEQYQRIIKDHGAVLLFGMGKFGASLIMNAPKKMPYRYEWIWQKTMPVGF